MELDRGQECARIRANDVNDLLRKLDVATAELDGMALTKVSADQIRSHHIAADLSCLHVQALPTLHAAGSRPLRQVLPTCM